jgi:Flp pilus assembly protein TadG
MLFDKRGAEMAEAAISIPVVLMVLVVAMSIARAGYAAMAARNAANYGARVGSVAGDNAKSYAEQAAYASLKQSGIQGDFSVDAEVWGYGDSSVVSVTVSWSSPTLLAAVCSMIGEGCPDKFSGVQRSVWRREGWLE